VAEVVVSQLGIAVESQPAPDDVVEAPDEKVGEEVRRGLVLGPVLGGWFVQDFSWRLIFYVNVPIGLIGIVVALRYIPKIRMPRPSAFDVPGFIETVTAYVPLEPGDLLATGTPAGVGIGFAPPRYLQPGDVVRIAISGLGELTNPVV